MTKDCKREPFPPLVPGPDPCSPPPPPEPCGCGPWPYMSPPSPVLSVPGNSLYDSMMHLNQKVDTCIRAYNDVIARGYETLRNMEGANEAQGSFYNNKEISPISGYNPTDSSAYQLYKKQVLDCEGQPIRMEFRYGYDNVTNNGVKEGIFDAGRMVDADIIFPCQPDGDKVTGILYFKGKPVEGQVDPGFQNGFTVGFSRAGVMRVYPNTTDPHQLFLDEIENSAGCAGVLILEGKKVSAEMIEAIPDSAETRQRVCIGQNGYTREVYILTCKDEDTVPGQVGLTSDECANILLERGCTIAVEIAENDTGVLVNKGQLYQGSLDLSALDFNGFWYISKRCRYRNDYQSELADLYYDFGESLNNFRLQTSELKNIYDQLNQETQDRIAADNALSNRIDDLSGRIDGLVEEMKNYTDNQIAALTLRLTNKTLLLPYVQKSGDSMQGPLDMGDNKITSSYVPAEDADITNKKFVDDAIAAQHEADANQFVDVAGDTMTGPLDMGTNKVTSSATPTEENDLVNRKFTESQYVNTSGDTMTGPLAMGAQKITSSYNPQAGEDLTNKAYVDAGLNEKLSLSGGTMTGNILMGNNKVVSSAPPVSGDDLTNKDYVDTAIGNQHTADAEQFVDVAGDTMTGPLDMGTNKVTSSATPTEENDLVNRKFTESQYVNTSGDTMTGPLAMGVQKITSSYNPQDGEDLTNKQYVDTAINSQHTADEEQFVDVSGDTMTGALDMGENKVTSSYTPTDDHDLTNKTFVDTELSKQKSELEGEIAQAIENVTNGTTPISGVVKTDGSTPLTATWNAGQKITGIPEPTADGDAANKKYVDDAVTGVQVEGVVKTDGSTPLTATWNAGQKITGIPTPTENSDVANKEYVDAHAGGGGDVTAAGNNTFTGTNTFNNPVTVGTPTADTHAATKAYVDSRPGGGGDVTAAGDNTFTGNNTFNNPVTVGTPTADAHAATKAYVDSRPGGGGDVTAAGNNTFTGNNTFNNPVTVGTPTADAHAATKAYVDSRPGGGGDVTAAGDNTFTGTNTFNGNFKAKNVSIDSGGLTASAGGQGSIQINANPSSGDPPYINIGSSGNYGCIKYDTSGRLLLHKDEGLGYNMTSPLPVEVGTPINSSDAATKEYVDAHAGGGGDVTAAGNNTFTGNNTFNNPVTVGTPTANAHAANKSYVDAGIRNVGSSLTILPSDVRVHGVVCRDYDISPYLCVNRASGFKGAVMFTSVNGYPSTGDTFTIVVNNFPNIGTTTLAGSLILFQDMYQQFGTNYIILTYIASIAGRVATLEVTCKNNYIAPTSNNGILFI